LELPDGRRALQRLVAVAAQEFSARSSRPSWIYEAVRAGTLPCLRIGRHIRFTRTMLEEWLQGGWA
jgi:hypothetical protein